MAKRPKNGVCVHCLESFEEGTWDHVFPESWYPKSTPENLEKWKIPSCEKCNREYGKMEREMLQHLGLAVNPDNIASSGIPEKVHRALDKNQGHSEKDSSAREKAKEKIASKLIEVTAEYESGVFPSLDPHEYEEGARKMGIPIDAEWFERLSIKIVKGVTYLETGKLIDEPYEITYGVLREEPDNPILKAVQQFGKVEYRGPGLRIGKARTGEDPIQSVWIIDIWQQFRLYAFVLDKNAKKQRGY